jgi:tetratricopeptide (TPR) repeat protein
MPKINPINPMDTEEHSDGIIWIETIYKEIFYFFKIFLIILTFMFILIFLIFFVIYPEDGIIIKPFKSNEKNLSGEFIADLLSLKLADIKAIGDTEIVMNQNQHHQMNTFLKTPFHFCPPSIDYRISDLGTVSEGGLSLSLGQLVLSIKELIGTKILNKEKQTITGSIQRSGSKLYIVALLSNPPIGGISALDMEKTRPNGNYETVENITDDLAFQLATALINREGNSGKNPQTCEAFKSLTKSWRAYSRYAATYNIIDLNESKYWAIRANNSEPSYSESYILFYNLGYSYLLLEEYDVAEQLFRNATNLNSSDADSWNGLGIAFFKLNNSSLAINAYNTAIRINQRNADILNETGKSLFDEEDYETASKSYNNAFKINKRNAEIWYNEALALHKLNRDNESIRAYDNVTSINPKIEDAWYNKGTILNSHRRYNEAILAFDKVLELNPRNEKAWNNKGVSLNRKGNYSEAIQDFDNALKIDPEFAMASNNKNRTLRKLAAIQQEY